MGERELTAVERASLGLQARNGKRVFLALVLGYPTMFVMMLALLAILEPQGEGPNTFWAIVMILMTVGIAVVALLAREAKTHSRGLRGDLRGGTVLVFSGSLLEPDPENETQRALLKKGALTIETAHIQSLEVLPVSRRVLRANGRVLKPWVSSAWTETAETPAFASMAAEWLEPVAINEEAEVYSGQRELSAGEKEELQRIVKDLRRPMWPAILLTLWSTLVAGGYALSGRTPDTGDFYRILFLGVLALGNDVVFGFRQLRARRMAADLRQGIVLILRIATKTAAPDEPATDQPKEFEVLPHTRALWTEHGRPATWRTSDSWLSVPRRVPK